MTTTNTRKPNAEVIQGEIIRRICYLEYLPGSQLKEAELADEFGVSRTPVRDAIHRIKHLGMVESRNGVGTVVVALSEDKIRDVYDMRLQLATLIGTMSDHEITLHEQTVAEELLEQSVALKNDFAPKKYVELNHRLHKLVADLISNTLLKSYWEQTYYQAASTWYQIGKLAEHESAIALIQELQDLNQALQQNDLTAVGLVQRIHIGYGYQRIKDHLFEQDETAE